MPYTPNTPWQDSPSTATPISAARLQNMEDGIEASALAGYQPRAHSDQRLHYRTLEG